MLKRMIWRAAIAAVALFAALFLGRLTYEFSGGDKRTIDDGIGQFSMSSSNFELSRKNYASVKVKAAGAALPQQPTLGDGQKYEKIATIGQSTREFDSSRKAITTAVEGANGLVQYEQLQGFGHHRTLYLGIGVPPAKFDEFVEGVSKIGKLTNLSIIKNDKTNEYRKLRAQRESLEKALKALAELNVPGGSVEERLKVQARMSDLETSLQNLGVALGDFDSENEFCTVKITLTEAGPPSSPSWRHQVFAAFVWSAKYFLTLTGGFLALCVAFWLGAVALSIAVRVSQRLSRD